MCALDRSAAHRFHMLRASSEILLAYIFRYTHKHLSAGGALCERLRSSDSTSTRARSIPFS